MVYINIRYIQWNLNFWGPVLMIVKSLHGGKKLHVILRIHVYSFLEYIIIKVTLNPVNYIHRVVNYISDESALQNGNLNIVAQWIPLTYRFQV